MGVRNVTDMEYGTPNGSPSSNKIWSYYFSFRNSLSPQLKGRRMERKKKKRKKESEE
jgi:hypothetical protein